ncbi:cytochrome-c peroxidase [Roseateles sp.]|uniref:cytochrome-c peroxidase n=1 Tax=Roseateles sp. TaxID=1971397 RepID=UPI003BABC1C5
MLPPALRPLILLLVVLAGCGGGSAPPAADPPVALSALAQLGERLYNDHTLSGSGRMSCASCHDAAFAHGPPNALAVQVGGQFETQFGLRAAPSIRYLERQPAFALGSGAPDAVRGGLMADGRADSLAAQAHLPLLNPLELDNGSDEVLARRIRAAAYAAQFAALFGPADAATTVQQATQALQAFQVEDARFHPYDSKFDQVRAGREQFSAAEQRGLIAYRDPARGNCAACHTDTSTDGRPPLFTDFGYAATGVPRNAAIPANADPAYFDLGLCGPQRTDQAARPALCGLFRTPGLRNVAVKRAFFHNGVMHSLAQVLDFYNTRDTAPERWYPVRGGVVQVFDDLPLAYRANVTKQAPLDGRPAGSAPPMSAQDLADIGCFLRTLSDGHVAGTPPGEDCRR